MSKTVFSVRGDRTLINDTEVICRGLRCSNALYSEKSTDDLIANLRLYACFGVNSFSVFVMGNRFGDIPGYQSDGSLAEPYARRLARIIEAADELSMVVVVGCLYWGESTGKFARWKQEDANAAVFNTVAWLSEQNYRNVLVDVDNEGMGRKFAGFDDRELVLAAKRADEAICVATNYIGTPPDEIDIAVHHSDHAPGKPYIETEGVPQNAPGGYWGRWSRRPDPRNYYRNDPDFRNYVRIGRYTEAMKANSIELAKQHFDRGDGYFFASTWLQAVPPFGPNHAPGGDGSEWNPGIRWWLEWLRDEFGPYDGT